MRSENQSTLGRGARTTYVPAAKRPQVRNPESALPLLHRGALGAIGREHQRAVARALDGTDEGRIIGASRIDLDSGALGREVHVRTAHAGHAAERILDARNARRACHPRDDEVAQRYVGRSRLHVGGPRRSLGINASGHVVGVW